MENHSPELFPSRIYLGSSSKTSSIRILVPRPSPLGLTACFSSVRDFLTISDKRLKNGEHNAHVSTWKCLSISPMLIIAVKEFNRRVTATEEIRSNLPKYVDVPTNSLCLQLWQNRCNASKCAASERSSR